MAPIIPLEQSLRPALPTVIGNVDYTQFEQMLKRMDELLRQGGVERQFIGLSLAALQAQCANPSAAQIRKDQTHAIWALRTMLLKSILGEDYRGLSRRLAECQLFRWFCHLDELVIKVPSKSTLQRYANWLSAEQMRTVIDALTLAAAGGPGLAQQAPMGLANAIELDVVFLDTTCVRANIHFPVDWVLLRDAARTLIKAVELIRRHGLKHRMPEPSGLLRQMNRLAIEMTHTRRKADSRKARKRVLRGMKKLTKVISGHAQRYHSLLKENWAQTDWTQAQAGQVLRRIEGVLAKVPGAIEQAHERIIGERPVPNAKKRLSLYEDDVHVIVRGKAGAEVEFGNGLLLAEQSDGLIVDFDFSKAQAPSDSKWLEPSLERQEALSGQVIAAIGGDRGFDSAANRQLLETKGIVNGICPKAPAELKARCRDEVFAAMQRRRAQTEARIAIFKNKLLGGLVRSKGHANRAMAIHWAVLTHNLWVLSRLPKADEQAPPLAAAA